MTGHSLREEVLMDSEAKYRVIRNLALLSTSATNPLSFATDFVHTAFRDSFDGGYPTGVVIKKLNREGNLKLLAGYGFPESALRDIETISIWEATPSSEAARDRKIIHITGDLQWRTRYPHIKDSINDGECVIAIPLVYRLGVIGAISLRVKNCPHDIELDEEFWLGVASICSFFVVQVSDQLNPIANPQGAIYLTERQRKIVGLFKDGLTIAEIAGKLGYSHSTIRQEIIKIYRILGVKDRKSAITMAASRNLL